MGSVLLGWLVFGPMVLAFPVYFLERRSRGTAQAATLAFCIVELAAAVGLFALPGTEWARRPPQVQPFPIRACPTICPR